MLRDRKELWDVIEIYNNKIITHNDKCIELYDYIFDKYNLPRGIISDIVCGRRDMVNLTDFVLFALTDGFDSINKDGQVKSFFTEKEIQIYSNQKYEEEKIKFPLEFEVVQVTDDQWIGSISLQKLMMLRSAQIISYNINTQRTTTKIIKNGKESFRITLNRAAVSSIEKNMKSNLFIANTLTFNVPMDTEYNFEYDPESHILRFNSLDHLDIIDGYHRYVAACRVHDEDISADMKLEIRIVNWEDQKAKQFIYQEDQKTKMRKIDSDAMNQNKESNIVATKLNNKIDFDLKGCIGNNAHQVPLSEFSYAIGKVYFGSCQKYDNKYIIQVTNEISSKLNYLCENMPECLEHRYTTRELIILTLSCKYFDTEIVDIYKNIDKILSTLTKRQNEYIGTMKLTNPLIQKILTGMKNVK